MDTRQVIREFIKTTFFADGFADGESFLRSGVVDSTGILELVEFVESRFQVKVQDNELVPENVDSVDNLARFIGRKRQ